jgi:ribosomal protein S12 methylthiotransferase
MEVQQDVAFEWNEAQIGRQLDVILDTAVPDEETPVGRSYADAPDVDGVVYVTGEGLAAGSIVPCEIVARSEYDLVEPQLASHAK